MNGKRILGKWLIPAGILLIAAGMGMSRLGDDMTVFLKWWLAILVLGIVFFPISSLIFSKFHDKGWLFSKTIGLAVSGWLMWYLASLKILKFTQLNCYLAIVICLLANAVVLVLTLQKEKKNPSDKPSVFALSEKNLNAMLVSEIIFFVFFLFWTYLGGFNPKAYGTEKFMDYGFMTSMMRTDYMPPNDFWMSGEKLNYYYVGQYLIVYLTKVSGVSVGVAYNLGLMMIAGFGFALPFSLMYQVAADCRPTIYNERKGKEETKEPGKLFPVIVGSVSGIAVCFAGNMHYVIYGLFKPFIQRITGVTIDNYWFPDATRYIGYNPETNDKTIHEFPLYSFVLGDLHAHVINIMFVLTVLAMLYAILQHRKSRMDDLRAGLTIGPIDLKKEALQPAILMIGFFIGLFTMTNYWDFPIYFVVSGAIILFSNLVLCRFTKQAWILTAIHAAIVFVVGVIVCLPFTLSFDQIASTPQFTVARTPYYQLAVLWGLPITAVISFFIVMAKKTPQRKRIRFIRKTKENDLEVVLQKNEHNAAKSNTKSTVKTISKNSFSMPIESRGFITRFINSLQISDLFVITIGLCAVGLILIPEVIFIKDIYSGDYKRANTMFKLTYQAYIMFGLCMGYILIRYVRFRETVTQIITGSMLLACLTLTVGYFGNATDSWFGDYKDVDRYQGLDATAYLETESNDDYLATNWLNENITGDAVVLEEAGNGYTFHERVSVTTGLSTVLGWNAHEWLWRSNRSGGKPAVIDERAADIEAIYTGTNINEVKALIEKYDIDYIYVGEGELVDGTDSASSADETHTYYYHGYYYRPIEVNHELLKSLGEVVFDSPATISKDYETYIIKVNKE